MSKSEKLRSVLAARQDRRKTFLEETRALKKQLASAEASDRRAKASAIGHLILALKPELARTLARELTGNRERGLFGLPPIRHSGGGSGESGSGNEE